MAILRNILSELANSYIVPKENIARFYGLTESVDDLTDTEVISSLTNEFKNIPTTKRIKYRSDIVPVIMKESDGEIGYFMNYEDLKKYSVDQDIDISSAFYAVCQSNNFDPDNAYLCFDSSIIKEIENTKSLIFESQNVYNKLYNKIALSDLLSDIQNLNESGIMLFIREMEDK